MKKLTLFLLLVGLSVICMGQLVINGKPATIKQLEKEVSKVDKEKLLKELTKEATSYWYGKQIAYRNYEGSTLTFKPVKTKLMLSSTGVVTINIDEFKVTDTIWIQVGKRKVGIPAYKFLEYFKEDYPTLTSPLWNGSSYIRGL
jgi:hypothetical protein